MTFVRSGNDNNQSVLQAIYKWKLSSNSQMSKLKIILVIWLSAEERSSCSRMQSTVHSSCIFISSMQAFNARILCLLRKCSNYQLVWWVQNKQTRLSDSKYGVCRVSQNSKSSSERWTNWNNITKEWTARSERLMKCIDIRLKLKTHKLKNRSQCKPTSESIAQNCNASSISGSLWKLKSRERLQRSVSL